MSKKLFNFIEEYLDDYEVIAAITNGSITAKIINYMNDKNISAKKFAKDIGVPYKKIREWISADYDFTITDFCLLCSKNIITKDEFDFKKV